MAIKIKTGQEPANFVGTDQSFGRLDDRQNDPSTWRIGMASHRNLFMTSSGGPFLDQGLYRKLAPLGSFDQIKAFIDSLLERAEIRNGGPLPSVYFVPVNAEGATDLIIPTQGMTASSQILLEEAAAEGIETLSLATEVIAQAGQAARNVGAIEQGIREEMRATPDWADAPEDEFEREVSDRLRTDENASAARDDIADSSARYMLNELFAARYPGESEEQITARVDDIVNAAERQGRGTDMAGQTVAQRTSAIATAAGSITESLITASMNTEDRMAIDVAADVLNAIGGICTLIGSAVGGIAGAVLVVIGALVEIIAAILRALRGYAVDPEDGVNSEWSSRDLRLIVQERLRILCQTEEVVFENWGANWEAAFGSYTADEQLNALKQMVYVTARSRGWPKRLDNARAIAVTLGSADESMRKIDDIKSWLIYVGVKEEDAELVWEWLYDARRTTEILKRRKYLKDHGRWGTDYTGFSGNFLDKSQANCGTSWCRERGQATLGEGYQAPCDDYDIGPADPPGSDTFSGSARPNIWKGSNEWFRACQRLDTHGRNRDRDRASWQLQTEFVAFDMGSLKRLYTYLADRLNVRFANADGSFNEAPAVALPRFDLNDVEYLGIGNDCLTRVLELDNTQVVNVGGLNVVCSPSLGSTDLAYLFDLPGCVVRGTNLVNGTFTLNLGGWSWRCWVRLPLTSVSLISQLEAWGVDRGGFLPAVNEYIRSAEVRQLVTDELIRMGAVPSGLGSAGTAIAASAGVALGIFALSKLL